VERTLPTISVVVPCFNYGRYLGDCVNSLLGGPTCLGIVEPQSFDDFEIVIVDDASTDDSWQTIQALASQHEKVRGLHLSTNQGTPTVLNVGVERSRGEYVQVLSADDMLEPWCLQKHIEACRANPHRVVYGDLRTIKAGKRERTLKLPNYSCELVLSKNPMSAGIMYPKQAWRDAEGYPETMTWGREDWAFNIALMLAGWCGIHIEAAGYLYRRDRQNRSLRTGNRHRDKVQRLDPTPDGTPTWREFFKNQLRGLYPEAYAGRYNVGCCGGRRSKSATKSASNPVVKSTTVLPGRGGMTRLEYIGGNVGDTTWWGPETQTRYVFGGNRKVGYVDSKDAAGMLAMKKDDKAVFRVYKPPVQKPKPKPAPAPQPEPEPEPAREPEPELPDLQMLTIAEAKELDITPEQAGALIEQEREGKSRITLLAYLEDLRDA